MFVIRCEHLWVQARCYKNVLSYTRQILVSHMDNPRSRNWKTIEEDTAGKVETRKGLAAWTGCRQIT